MFAEANTRLIITSTVVLVAYQMRDNIIVVKQIENAPILMRRVVPIGITTLIKLGTLTRAILHIRKYVPR